MADLNHTSFGLAVIALLITTEPVAAASQALLQLAPIVVDGLPAPVARPAVDVTPRRPNILVPLYVSFVALQAADGRTSYVGVRRGLEELNPVLGRAVRSPGQLAAIKGATTAATIAATELLWRRHRKAAVIAMIVFNVSYGAIVANNVGLLR